MANIPVRKKSSSSLSWLWLLLALVVLAVIAWWIWGGTNNRNQQVNTAPVSAQPSTGGTVNSTAALTDSPLTSLIGRDVAINGAPVESLAGDMAFYVGANADQRVLVVFNQQPSPNSSREGKLDINPGSHVNISGVVRSSRDPLPQGVHASLPSSVAAYVYANELSIAK